jgi:uncharacterized protein
MSDSHVIDATQRWLSSFIIHYDICPFARREQQRNSIRYRVSDTTSLEAALETMIMECAKLDAEPDIATTLLIFAAGFIDFDDYLDLLTLAEQLIVEQGYEGIYQLASFHPQYGFADSDVDDAANYTNRSPYPMLHIIREEQLEQALTHYPNPEQIPERNIQLTRTMGSQALEALLKACHGHKPHDTQ